jgi:hypothetical protein
MSIGVFFLWANQVKNTCGWRKLLNDENVNEVLIMGHFKENNNNIQKLLKDKFQICNNSIDISYTMKGRNSLKDVEEY